MPNSGCLGIYLCFFGQEELDTHYLHGAGKILFAGRYHHKIADFDGAILGDIVVGFAAVFKAHAAIGQLPFAAAKPVVNREGENVAGAVKLNKVVQVFDDCSKILRQPVFVIAAGNQPVGAVLAVDMQQIDGGVAGCSTSSLLLQGDFTQYSPVGYWVGNSSISSK